MCIWGHPSARAAKSFQRNSYYTYFSNHITLLPKWTFPSGIFGIHKLLMTANILLPLFFQQCTVEHERIFVHLQRVSLCEKDVLKELILLYIPWRYKNYWYFCQMTHSSVVKATGLQGSSVSRLLLLIFLLRFLCNHTKKYSQMPCTEEALLQQRNLQSYMKTKRFFQFPYLETHSLEKQAIFFELHFSLRRLKKLLE